MKQFFQIFASYEASEVGKMKIFDEVIDVEYSCSRAIVRTEDTQITSMIAAQRGIYSTPREAMGLVMENDEFFRLRNEELKKPLY